MEPGLIIIGGVVSCILAIFFGVRERNHKHAVDVLQAREMMLIDDNIRCEEKLHRELHCYKDRERKAGLNVFHMQQELKQNQVDITCFRAELGLPPRKLTKDSY